MHDPCTVAFEIRRPWRQKPSQLFPKGYRPTMITIWHVDPERDGTDDSCGWFKRSRHGDKEVLAKIRRAFESAGKWDSDHSGWFEPEGKPRYSAIAITLAMFRTAAWHHFNGSWRKTERFMKRNLYDLIHFAENSTDSMHPAITLRYGPEKREDRIESAASIVYGHLLRLERHWWQHPRWHFWHWRFQIHVVQAFKRWAFSRCRTCGKRFPWNYSPVTNSWDSGSPRWFRNEGDVHHMECMGMSVGAEPARSMP